MRLWILLPMLALALIGCQAKPAARAASSPRAINELTTQTMVYTCPKCGADYDAPGKCPMDDAALVKTRVDYICPADNQPVSRAGKCPRCAANARIVKTAMAPAAGGTAGS